MARPARTGLLSRDGWTVVDDSTAALQQLRLGVGRRAARGDAGYLFLGYGHDYGAPSATIQGSRKDPLPPASSSVVVSRMAYTDTELMQLVADFHAHDLPLDVLVIDMTGTSPSRPEGVNDLRHSLG